jgi:tetratricopeptide (TPR) repeat protein
MKLFCKPHPENRKAMDPLSAISREQTLAKSYWEQKVDPSNLDSGQVARLAESLFQLVWKKLGQDAAIRPARQVRFPNEQLEEFQSKFYLGCNLWAEGKHELALQELQESLAIHEGVVAVINAEGKVSEDRVRLLYAIGIVYTSLSEYEKACDVFRRAFRLCSLYMSKKHILTRSSKYMLGVVFQHQGKASEEVESHLAYFAKSIEQEKRGDAMHYIGDFGAALVEYRKAFKGESTVLRADLLCKVATVRAEVGAWNHSRNDLAKALAMYTRYLGRDHPDTVKTLDRFANAHAQAERNQKGRIAVESAP